MVKELLKNIVFALIILMLAFTYSYADGPSSTGKNEPKNVTEAGFQSRCAKAKDLNFPKCASSPAQCESAPFGAKKNDDYVWRTPFNCIFLQEPIGGKPGYDLYKLTPDVYGNNYTLWTGEAIIYSKGEAGPFQAILAYEEGKELEGSFGLLYNYLKLIYNFLSGIIIAFVILISIIGGIRMTISAGNQEAFGGGRSMIVRALIGMAIWFTASVILYTINPNFFAF